ncbi:MAG TPA: hypothetical protein VFU59_04740 [Candidatus Eisenbacteria bacterium]|nr:hypothetical protein [Candidatus Eisenbacteria bacterium]
MKRFVSAAAALLLAAAVSHAETGTAAAPDPAMQAARDARMQEMAARMMRMQAQVQQLNQRIAAMPVPQGYKDLAIGLGIACERLREMERHSSELRDQAGAAAAGIQARAIDRLQDRLQVMNREMDETHEGLQRLIVMEARPGAPVDAAEQMRRAQHQQEMEQVMTRVQERIKALDAWSKGGQVPAAAKEFVKDLTLLRDRLRMMNQTCDKLVEDPQVELDRDRTREIERLRDRFRVVFRELEESSDALESGVTS